MARYHGMIGFEVMTERAPGVWKPTITEREYFGDTVRMSIESRTTQHQNDDLRLSQEISIVADIYANENFQSMKYVTVLGVKWKITNVEPRYPRLVLTVGGVYNEQST